MAAPSSGGTTEAPNRELRALLGDIVARCEAFEVVAARVAHLEQRTQDDPGLIVRATGELVRRLDRLSAQVSALEPVPARLATVERVTSEIRRHGTGDDLARLAKQVEDMRARLVGLESAGTRLQALETDRKRLEAIDDALGGLVGREERLAGQLAALQQVPHRLAALEQSQPDLRALEIRCARNEERLSRLGEQLRAMEGVPQRFTAIEESLGAMAPANALLDIDESLAHVRGDLARLESQMTKLQAMPDQVKDLHLVQSRVVALDKVVVGLIEAIKHLSSEIKTVRENIAESAPQEAGGPERLHALERESQGAGEVLTYLSMRTEALARGLGAAIDVVDQLTHQVTTLEQAVSRR